MHESDLNLQIYAYLLQFNQLVGQLKTCNQENV